MDGGNTPRILILETDRRSLAALRGSTVKAWREASVRTRDATLAEVLESGEALSAYDVVLAGCDFATDGSAGHATLRALRAVSANPENPPVVLLTSHGSEYTAVQSIKAGAFDYLQRELLGREQIVSAIQRALGARRAPATGPVNGALRLFGYDLQRCLATRDNVSVHVAYSAEKTRDVVVKVLHRGRGPLSRDRNFERFVDEFKLHYDINDPAVAEIHDFRVTDQYCYIAMEYFALGHLGQRLKSALEPAVALGLAREIASALSIIHGAGIVHRDLKPGNVMIREDDSIALIDFGISMFMLDDAADTELSTDPIRGTPYYMSPEQARGEPTDERTDIYALGVILYQMLTGEKPYTGSSTEEILDKHCTAPVPALPAPLDHLQSMLDRLLAKSPEQRLATARELVEAIDAACVTAVTEVPRARLA